eukprot:NODE_1873_length_1352_cov_15.635918_g1779_i0.p1 GENE.NODE_1873_length_1352_cov_15.635918_g1779_i0~~NODE_1873_length_1352_cov_15.635918_g1779_i0.p1  ORF type:complete len:369 (-),score=15.00 NODE_1873_length_1352_cov_15.635918_g1779_i0:244-1302(-)
MTSKVSAVARLKRYSRYWFAALFVWIMWISFFITRPSYITDSFADNWPMVLTMIFGSFVAGFTAMGGGAIAFPVTSLILDWTAVEGRDFSTLIQAVGMTAASYFIISRKGQEFKSSFKHLPIIIISAQVGMLISFELVFPNVKGLTIKMLFSTFAPAMHTIVLALQYWKPKFFSDQNTDEASRPLLIEFLAFVVAPFGGGMLTSMLGSGADVTFFVAAMMLGVLPVRSAHLMSVILMASCSIIGSMDRNLHWLQAHCCRKLGHLRRDCMHRCPSGQRDIHAGSCQCHDALDDPPAFCPIDSSLRNSGSKLCDNHDGGGLRHSDHYSLCIELAFPTEHRAGGEGQKPACCSTN